MNKHFSVPGMKPRVQTLCRIDGKRIVSLDAARLDPTIKNVKSICSKLVCGLLASIFVVGLSAQTYGSDGLIASGDGCCCQSVPVQQADSDCGEPVNDCCPEPGEKEESPCSCACSSCCVVSRTVNLLSIDLDLAVLLPRDAQPLLLMPNRPPASAVLSVDIQPPIA